MSVNPSGIASTLAFGTANVQHQLNLDGRGIASTAAFGSPTVLTAASGSTFAAYSIFIAGVDRSRYVRIPSLRRRAQIGGASRATLSFSLVDPTGAYRPSIDDEVIVYEGSTSRFFSGGIERLSERFYNGTSISEIAVDCTDKGVICDRRVVGKYYSLFLGGVPTITISDIVTRFLDGTGITYDTTGTPSVDLGEQLFNYCTVTEALNQIAEKCNAEWSVDWYSVLRMFEYDSGCGTAPVTITDNDGNFDAITVERARSSRRNRQGVRNSQSATAIWTDTVTATAGQIAIPTTYALEVKPYVEMDGEVMTVAMFGSLGEEAFDFYYIENGVGIFTSPLNPLSGGEVVTIKYPSRLSVVAWAENAADIASHGKWESVADVKDVPDEDALQAIADGLLSRGLTEPVSVTLVSRRAGWAPGQLVTINVTTPPLDSTLLIESVDSEEVAAISAGRQAPFFRHTIRARNSALDTARRGDTFFQKLITLSKQAVDRVSYHIGFTLAETIEGVTNPGLTTGVKLASRVADKDGTLRDCTLYFRSSATTPTASRVVVDVYRNGVSIFPTGGQAIYPAGATEVQRVFIFATMPYRITKGDVFTLEVLEADSTATDGVLELVVYG